MPRSEKQKLKLFYIIELFRKKTDEEHPITITEIIDYLAEIGISAERKSIYRDFEAMEELGFEIVQVHNKHFEYYLANRSFETAELKMLVDAVQASRFITKRKSRELIKKLENLATEHDAAELSSQVFVTNRIKSLNESIYYNVDCINCAISRDVKITFKYFDWSIKKQKQFRHDGRVYQVSPWSLVWNNEYYYLIAYDAFSYSIKHYRVDKMVNIALTEENREGKESFRNIDVAQYSQRLFGMFNGDVKRVTLSCSSELTNAVIDRFGTDVKFVPDECGNWFSVDVDVAISPVFLSWVFMFGGKVKIVSPTDVAEDLKIMAEGILQEA